MRTAEHYLPPVGHGALTYVSCNAKGKGVPVHNYAPRQEDVLGEWRYCDQFHTPTAFSRGKNPSAHRIGGWSTPHLCVIPKGNGKYSRLLAFV